jgi:hypothetical protein
MSRVLILNFSGKGVPIAGDALASAGDEAADPFAAPGIGEVVGFALQLPDAHGEVTAMRKPNEGNRAGSFMRKLAKVEPAEAFRT